MIKADIGVSPLNMMAGRKTLQGRILSLLLWILAMDKLLSSAQKFGIKSVAYADALVVMISVIRPQTISVLLERTLGEVNKWLKYWPTTTNQRPLKSSVNVRKEIGSQPHGDAMMYTSIVRPITTARRRDSLHLLSNLLHILYTVAYGTFRVRKVASGIKKL